MKFLIRDENNKPFNTIFSKILNATFQSSHGQLIKRITVNCDEEYFDSKAVYLVSFASCDMRKELFNLLNENNTDFTIRDVRMNDDDLDSTDYFQQMFGYSFAIRQAFLQGLSISLTCPVHYRIDFIRDVLLRELEKKEGTLSFTETEITFTSPTGEENRIDFEIAPVERYCHQLSETDNNHLIILIPE
ncbi:hypothetical protein [Polystyrenella longa]|nr:hypothetical protein [Polystyrenella longa]